MEITKEKILQELALMGFARAEDLMVLRDGVWTITDPLPSDAGAAIASLETTGKGVKVRFYDKLKVLELLGRLLGLFPEEKSGENAGSAGLLEAILQATEQPLDSEDLEELEG